jgi:hypothetical protein
MKKRGFVLTLDAVLAAFVVLTILTFANAVINRDRVGQWSEPRLLGAGYDVLGAMYNRGILQGLDESAINQALNESVPGNYAMRIQIRSYQAVNSSMVNVRTLDVGPSQPGSSLQTHGMRTFITLRGNDVETYNVAEFWIWLI